MADLRTRLGVAHKALETLEETAFPGNRPVAFFDFDGTLTTRDSLLPFLSFVRGPQLFLDLLTTGPAFFGYAAGMLARDQVKEALLRHTLAGLPYPQLAAYGERFAQEKIPLLLRPDTLSKLREHQRQGHLCVLVSASLEVYLKPWAKTVGFGFCLATRLETDANGRVTGRLSGRNCRGEEKVWRIQQLIARLGNPQKTYAYGDSPGDRAMLDFVEEAIWVKRWWSF